MLDLGQIWTRDCQRLTRRALLQVGALGTLGLSLPDFLRLRAQAAQPARPPNAVILLWLWGGPSHLDTFDLKPDAPIEYRGPFQPIATKVPGIRICELLPRLALRADQFALIRSMNHTSNDHGVAGTIGLTGSIAGAVGLDGKAQGGSVQPSSGSIVARLRGDAPNRLPSYTIIGTPLNQGFKPVVGEGGGLLGTRYDPFRLEYDPIRGVDIPGLDLPKDVTTSRFQGRWNLLHTLDRPVASVAKTRAVESVNRYYGLAHDLITSRRTLEVLKLEREADAVRGRYGRFRFGQCCLLARRLVEAGIPFVQVNWSKNVEAQEDGGDGGWDMHDRNFQILQDRHLWMFDQALSALLDDLRDRGLLDTTLVVAMGEFGRTPKINNKAGREHWNNCYTALLAGGGVRGGTVIGASDRLGEHPIDRPVTPADVGATILDRLGIGAAELASVGLAKQGQVVHHLF